MIFRDCAHQSGLLAHDIIPAHSTRQRVAEISRSTSTIAAPHLHAFDVVRALQLHILSVRCSRMLRTCSASSLPPPLRTLCTSIHCIAPTSTRARHNLSLLALSSPPHHLLLHISHARLLFAASSFQPLALAFSPSLRSASLSQAPNPHTIIFTSPSPPPSSLPAPLFSPLFLTTLPTLSPPLCYFFYSPPSPHLPHSPPPPLPRPLLYRTKLFPTSTTLIVPSHPHETDSPKKRSTAFRWSSAP